MKTVVSIVIVASIFIFATANPEVPNLARGLDNLLNRPRREPVREPIPLPSLSDINKVVKALAEFSKKRMQQKLGVSPKVSTPSIEDFSIGDIAKVADGVRKGAEIVSTIAGALGGKSLEEFDFLALEDFNAEALEEFNFGDIAKVADAVGKGAKIVSDIANVLNNK